MLERWYADVTAFVLLHLPKIAAAFAATLLALYGADVTRRLRRRIRRWPFVARAATFVLVVGFCFGVAALMLTSVLGRLLHVFGRPGVVPMVIVLVLGLGLLAEGRRQI